VTVRITSGADADLALVRRDPGDDPLVALRPYTCAGGIWCDVAYEGAFATYTAAIDPLTRRRAVHAMVARIAEQGTEIVLYAPDDVQAFRSDGVTGLLSEPSDQRLVVFWPSVEQYEQVNVAHPPRDEEFPPRTFAALTVTGLALAALVVFLVDRRVQARR
jgi:hypothetical protein